MFRIILAVLIFSIMLGVMLFAAAKSSDRANAFFLDFFKNLEKKLFNYKKNKAEKRGVGYFSVTEDDDEYTKLLKKMGLDDSATEADIKKQYRKLVKEFHPDLQGQRVDGQIEGRAKDVDGNDDHRFEDLKKTYERLLQMRGSFFSK